MKARVLTLVGGLSQRTLLLAMGGVILLVALQGWLLLLHQPVSAYLQAGRERAALEEYALAPQRLPAEIERVERELAALKGRLAGTGSQLAPEHMIVDVVDRLAAVASRHRTLLRSVRPAGMKRVFMFDEMAFDIQAAGAYPALVGWLDDLERELGPLVVTQFSIRRGTDPGALNMELRVAAYRLAEPGGEAR